MCNLLEALYERMFSICAVVLHLVAYVFKAYIKDETREFLKDFLCYLLVFLDICCDVEERIRRKRLTSNINNKENNSVLDDENLRLNQGNVKNDYKICNNIYLNYSKNNK